MNLEHLGAQLRSCFCILFSPKQAGEHIKRTTKTGASRSASAALSGRARSRSARASAQAHMLSLARLWLICSCFSCVGCGLFFICIASRTLRKIIPRGVQEFSKSSRLTMRALSSKRPSARAARVRPPSPRLLNLTRWRLRMLLALLRWLRPFLELQCLQNPSQKTYHLASLALLAALPCGCSA